MGIGHRVRDGEEKPEPRRDVEPARVAVGVDMLALYVLQHEVRLTGRGHAGIDEPGDVRVRQPGQDGPLTPEPFLPALTDEPKVEELDRRAPLVAAVGAAREPDRAHAAKAQGRLEPPGIDDLAGQGSGFARGRVLQVTLSRDRLAFLEETGQLREESRIVPRERLEPGGPLRRRDLQPLVQPVAERHPTAIIDRGHSRSPPRERHPTGGGPSTGTLSVRPSNAARARWGPHLNGRPPMGAPQTAARRAAPGTRVGDVGKPGGRGDRALVGSSQWTFRSRSRN